MFLSQSFGDQTRYKVIITWMPQTVQQPQFTIWDVISRKDKDAE